MEQIIHLAWVLPLGTLVSLGIAVFKSNESNSKKVSRVYGRLDEEKDKAEKKFVRIDVCSILHKQLKDDITEMKSDIKETRVDIKAILTLYKNGKKIGG